MRTFFQISVLLVTIFLMMACSGKKPKPLPPAPDYKGTAVLITGAAARIPQEAALLEQLHKTGQLNNVVFIAGASSGALNAVMLNGILSGKITWKQYRNWLSQISKDSVYTQNDSWLPVDTSPLRRLLTRIVNDSLGYYKMKDLPIATAISVTELNRIDIPKRNYRLCSRKINTESDPELDIIEVLMASTAFPIVFPEQKFNSASTLPDAAFADGGIGDDHVPFRGLIDFMYSNNEAVEKVFIISRKSDLETTVNSELRALGLRDFRVFDKIGFSIDDILQKGFIRGLKEYSETMPDKLVENTFVYVPAFDENFLLLNFENLSAQYEITRNWAQKNNPLPLKEYLGKFE